MKSTLHSCMCVLRIVMLMTLQLLLLRILLGVVAGTTCVARADGHLRSGDYATDQSTGGTELAKVITGSEWGEHNQESWLNSDAPVVVRLLWVPLVRDLREKNALYSSAGQWLRLPLKCEQGNECVGTHAPVNKPVEVHTARATTTTCACTVHPQELVKRNLLVLGVREVCAAT